MWKNKRFLDMYKSLVNSLHLQMPDMSAPDAAIKEFQASMKTCALEAYNYLKGDSNFHFLKTKPWWNAELSKSHKLLQSPFNQWRSDSFNRDNDNVYFNR